MKTYIKFIIKTYLNSLISIFLILFSLIFILNLLSEIDYFKDIKTNSYLPIYLSLLNSPSHVIEMFPFIFLISVQFFFIKLFRNNEIEILKYLGLKNFTIIKIISITVLAIGIIIIVIFYNFSSNLKNIYLSIKSPYSKDEKYLAVVTKNGLWIKDKVNESIYFINSSKMENNFLKETFITEFDENYNVVKNISSKNIDIENNTWIIYDAEIYVNNNRQIVEILKLKTNFDYKKIQSLFSELSSQSIFELYDLKRNYFSLGYSTIEIDIFLGKLLSYPVLFILMAIFSCIIMLNFKKIKSTTFKVSVGLLFSVLIYYINNFFYVLGSTEAIPVIFSIGAPIIFLGILNSLMLYKINEK